MFPKEQPDIQEMEELIICLLKFSREKKMLPNIWQHGTAERMQVLWNIFQHCLKSCVSLGREYIGESR